MHGLLCVHVSFLCLSACVCLCLCLCLCLYLCLYLCVSASNCSSSVSKYNRSITACGLCCRWVQEFQGTKFQTYIDWMALASVISLLDVPALSLPCGFTTEGEWQ